MNNLNDFLKLDAKELQNSMVEDTIHSLKRSVERRRMDLEDKVFKAKKEVTRVSTITSLTNLDPERWVLDRGEALNKQKAAEAELAIFNENFKEEEEAEDQTPAVDALG